MKALLFIFSYFSLKNLSLFLKIFIMQIKMLKVLEFDVALAAISYLSIRKKLPQKSLFSDIISRGFRLSVNSFPLVGRNRVSSCACMSELSTIGGSGADRDVKVRARGQTRGFAAITANA